MDVYRTGCRTGVSGTFEPSAWLIHSVTGIAGVVALTEGGRHQSLVDAGRSGANKQGVPAMVTVVCPHPGPFVDANGRTPIG